MLKWAQGWCKTNLRKQWNQWQNGPTLHILMDSGCIEILNIFWQKIFLSVCTTAKAIIIFQNVTVSFLWTQLQRQQFTETFYDIIAFIWNAAIISTAPKNDVILIFTFFINVSYSWMIWLNKISDYFIPTSCCFVFFNKP